MSRFVGGVAHDFNNILQIVLGRAALLRDFVGDGDGGEHLAELTTAAERAQRMVQQLLSFGRQESPVPLRVPFDALVEGLVAQLPRPAASVVDVVLGLTAPRTAVFVDPAMMLRVLERIVDNAERAIDGRGTITISTRVVSPADAMVKAHPFVPPGVYACLSVEDTGRGIDAAILPFVFEPFFTTSAPSESSGMGLSECYGLIKQSGGFILLDSPAGRGTIVSVLFPCLAEEAQVGGPAVTVLVVDDDAVRRTATTDVVQRDGHHVLAAASSYEAFLQCELHPGEIEVLVAPAALADVAGGELADRLRRQYPALRAVLFGDQPVSPEASSSGDAALPREFSDSELREALRAVLATVHAAPDGLK